MYNPYTSKQPQQTYPSVEKLDTTDEEIKETLINHETSSLAAPTYVYQPVLVQPEARPVYTSVIRNSSCLSLNEVHKKVWKGGKCLRGLSYLLIVIGIIGAAANLYVILTSDDWRTVVVKDKYNNYDVLEFDSDTFVICQALKAGTFLLLAMQGVYGVKTFRPQEDLVSSAHSATRVNLRSTATTLYQKRVFKIAAATLFMIFVGSLYGQSMVEESVNHYIDHHYATNGTNSTNEDHKPTNDTWHNYTQGFSYRHHHHHGGEHDPEGNSPNEGKHHCNHHGHHHDQKRHHHERHEGIEIDLDWEKLTPEQAKSEADQQITAMLLGALVFASTVYMCCCGCVLGGTQRYKKMQKLNELYAIEDPQGSAQSALRYPAVVLAMQERNGSIAPQAQQPPAVIARGVSIN